MTAKTHRGKTPIDLAVTRNHKKIIAELIYYAITGNHKEIVAMLLAAGADFTATDTRGQAPIDIANEAGFCEIARLIANVKDSECVDSMDSLAVLARNQDIFTRGFFGRRATLAEQVALTQDSRPCL